MLVGMFDRLFGSFWRGVATIWMILTIALPTAHIVIAPSEISQTMRYGEDGTAVVVELSRKNDLTANVRSGEDPYTYFVTYRVDRPDLASPHLRTQEVPRSRQEALRVGETIPVKIRIEGDKWQAWTYDPTVRTALKLLIGMLSILLFASLILFFRSDDQDS